MPRPHFVWGDRGYGAVRASTTATATTVVCTLHTVVVAAVVVVVAAVVVAVAMSVRASRWCRVATSDVATCHHQWRSPRRTSTLYGGYIQRWSRWLRSRSSPPHSRGRPIQNGVAACVKVGKFQMTRVVAKCDVTRTLDPNRIKVSDGQTNEKQTVKQKCWTV